MDKVELTDSQQLIILKTWNDRPENPPSIPELMSLVWPELKKEQLDARNAFGRAIKEYLIVKGFNVPKAGYKPKGLIELTPEQKEYISNNNNTMSPLEMARVLFNNNLLSHASQEAKSVYACAESLPKAGKYYSITREELLEDYSPPNTLDRLCARINKYVKNINLDYKKLAPLQKKDCEALIGYLHNVRLIHQINQYIKPEDRMIFESSFIENCHNKPDLSFEDVDQYIILSTEKVIAASIQRTIASLEAEQERIINEEGKISMSLVETIKSAREEHNSCIKRIQSLYKSLTEERSKKLGKEIENKASLLNLVNTWKNYENRQNILKLRQKEKEKLRREIHELEELEAVKMRILGLSIDDIIDG